METYQKRVVSEKLELDEKLKRLKDFLLGDRKKEVPLVELERLQRQSVAMKEYSEILGERIEGF